MALVIPTYMSPSAGAATLSAVLGSEQSANAPLIDVLGAAAAMLGGLHDTAVELATASRARICLQPAVMGDGERIAQALGCDFPFDHRMLVPGHTLWSGERDGLEVQVRSALRTRAGATW